MQVKMRPILDDPGVGLYQGKEFNGTLTFDPSQRSLESER